MLVNAFLTCQRGFHMYDTCKLWNKTCDFERFIGQQLHFCSATRPSKTKWQGKAVESCPLTPQPPHQLKTCWAVSLAQALTWKTSWKALMSWTASSSWRQSSPLFTMTGRTAQPGRRPCGELRCIREHL